MNNKIENIIIGNYPSFQIKLSDAYYSDNGYIFGNIHIIINKKIIGDNNSINLINATTILDLSLTLSRADCYTPKVPNEVFFSSKEYIINKAFLPFVNHHEYQAIKNFLIDKKVSFDTPFGGSSAFELVSGSGTWRLLRSISAWNF